MILLFFHY